MCPAAAWLSAFLLIGTETTSDLPRVLTTLGGPDPNVPKQSRTVHDSPPRETRSNRQHRARLCKVVAPVHPNVLQLGEALEVHRPVRVAVEG